MAIRRPEPWEYELLRLTAEQHGIPFDQLARFLGCESEQAARVAKHLSAAGFTDYGRFLVAEPHWLWLTGRGARISGTEFAGGPPKVGAMDRIRAVNEVRLQITTRAPEARWVCGRTVFREQGRKGRRPNAVVEIGGERHAILVKHGIRQTEWRERDILESLMRGYDAVVAFCAPAPGNLYRRLADQHHWPKLVVRPLPAPSREEGR
ncbi:MAG TPA: hypothetical protein VHU86_04415 [Solirubrobacterales bacterium]|jgi:hypothetical protein|nr:hypothetical protein [Solirubrobacterales bacterium]